MTRPVRATHRGAYLLGLGGLAGPVTVLGRITRSRPAPATP